MFGTKGLDQGQRTLEPARRAPSHQGVRFDISGNRTQFGFAAVFFAACAAVMVIELLDPRGVVINHLIELGPRGADVFFGVLLLSALGMSGTSGFCFVDRSSRSAGCRSTQRR